MHETPIEMFESGIAVLAEDEPTWDDGPFTVRGVALPEDIAPNSANTESLERDERVRTYWPPEVVEAAADFFEGAKIVDGSEHDPESVAENPQPSPETILGEITRAEYKPGTGVLYEGEVDDPEIAKRIQRGRVEVSPTIYRSLADEAQDGLRPVEAVHGVRDLSIVAEGAADGNSIEPAAGSAAAMSAMAAEVLEAAFGEDVGAETFTEVAGVSFEGTREGELDEAALPSDDFEGHYLFDGETKSESSYPVVDADGFLRAGNVEAAFQLGARGGVSKDELHEKLAALNDEFSEPPIDPEKLESGSETMGAESPTETGSPLEGDDGPDDQAGSGAGEGPSTDADAGDTPDGSTEDTMSDDDTNTNITDTERELLAAADDTEEAIEVLRSWQDHEEPCIEEASEVETLRDQNSEAKQLFAEALKQRDGLSMSAEKIAENFGYEALREEFEDDDGEIAVETLVQTPETGQPEDDGSESDDVEALLEERGYDSTDEAVEALQAQYENYERAGWESQAAEVAEDLDTLGIEVN